jgi:hypothetical protein
LIEAVFNTMSDEALDADYVEGTNPGTLITPTIELKCRRCEIG